MLPVSQHGFYISCKQRGVAMVEFVISLPFLLMAIFAVAEFGVMFYTHTTLNSSVQDGARYMASNSILGGASYTQVTTDLRTEVGNLVVYGNIQGSGVPLIDGMDISMVQVECLNGSSPTPKGVRCNPDAVINNLSITPFTVSAQIQYAPILGNLITELTGTNLSIPLRASATNVSF